MATLADELCRALAGAPVVPVLGLAVAVDLTYCPLHGHRSWELVAHPSGRGTTRLGDGRRWDFAPGDAVLYAPHQRHDQQLSEPGDDLCLQFELPAATPALDGGALLAGVLDGELAIEARLLCRQRPGSPAERLAWGHRLSALLLRLAARCGDGAGPATAPEDHATRARRIIAERHRDLGRLEEVAAELGIGHDHLRHLFRKAFGTSLVGWLTEVRLARAKELLERSPLSLAGIAREVGWGNERYLCSVFRRLTGTSPGRWRQQRELPAGKT